MKKIQKKLGGKEVDIITDNDLSVPNGFLWYETITEVFMNTNADTINSSTTDI